MIFDKHLQLKLVRVSIEVNLILTYWSCSKFWSTSLGRDRLPLQTTAPFVGFCFALVWAAQSPNWNVKIVLETGFCLRDS